MDPVSLASSIITFIDAARKIKATLDQVGANRKRLRELGANVVKGIVDIEDLLANSKDMDPPNAAKLWELLDSLKIELELVHSRCSRFLERRRTGPFSEATATVSQWFQRGEIDAMINRLEKQVCACYLRCQVLLCGNIYSLLLLHREENRNNMQRLESAFSRWIIENDEQDLPNVIVGASGLSRVNWDYLNRQVQRVIEAYHKMKPHESIVCKELSESQLEELNVLPLFPWGDSVDIIFSICLKATSNSLNRFSSASNQTSLQDCAQSLLFLGCDLYDLRLYEDAETVLEMAVSLYSVLTAAHPTVRPPRGLAFGLQLLSRTQASVMGHLSVSEHALNACIDLYGSSKGIVDMAHIASALRVHCSHLHVNGFLGKALDFAQQNVVLIRELSLAAQDVIWSHPTAHWTASGESDVVFSSLRQTSSCTYVALHEANTLWVLAFSLAANGRFAEARVAGSDALSCLEAVLEADPWYKDVRGWTTEHWRVDLVTWVSIPRRPSQSGLTPCIDEVDDEEGS